MARKLRIQVVDTDGNVIHEGIDQLRVFSDGTPNNKFLGMGIGDLVKLFVYVVGVIIFLVKVDGRIAVLESAMMESKKNFQSIAEFMSNVDKYNSMHYGVEFSGGKPVYGRGKNTADSPNRTD